MKNFNEIFWVVQLLGIGAVLGWLVHKLSFMYGAWREKRKIQKMESRSYNELSAMHERMRKELQAKVKCVDLNVINANMKNRKGFPRSWNKWNPEELELLRQQYPTHGNRIKELRKRHSKTSINTKAFIIGIRREFNSTAQKMEMR